MDTGSCPPCILEVNQMAVFRIEKNKNYTVMANYHLRDISLSLKAKGLLSLMLSLPEGWDYTTKGLACICKDGVDSICSTVKELEKAGYVQRRRLRNELGHLTEIEYTILEKPVRPSSSENLPQSDSSANTGTPPKREKPVLGCPVLDDPELAFPEQAIPEQDEPEQEKPVQLNIPEPGGHRPAAPAPSGGGHRRRNRRPDHRH